MAVWPVLGDGSWCSGREIGSVVGWDRAVDESEETELKVVCSDCEAFSRIANWQNTEIYWKTENAYVQKFHRLINGWSISGKFLELPPEKWAAPSTNYASSSIEQCMESTYTKK